MGMTFLPVQEQYDASSVRFSPLNDDQEPKSRQGPDE